MAILKNYTVKMLVDGKSLQEYEGDGEIENENPNTVIKYVEATSNARFIIDVSVHNISGRMADAVSFCSFLDGTFVSNRILEKNKSGRDLWESVSKIEGSRGVSAKGDFELRPFIFSAIKIVDAPAPVALKPSVLNEIGTVMIKVYRGNVIKRNLKPMSSKSEVKVLNKSTDIAENKSKGLPLTHVSKLGEVMKTEPYSVADVGNLDFKDSPHATFIFKYCSKTALQDLLLIPRSPSPLPLEERPVEELSLEQLHEIVRRHQARLRTENHANATPIKMENELSINSVKRERSPEYEEILKSAQVKKVKVHQPIGHGETVELSDDD